jgi:hypothetical protein
MKTVRLSRRRGLAAAGATAVLLTLALPMGVGAQAAAPEAAPAAARAATSLVVTTLSNRADLVSGGQALVEVRLPQDADPRQVRVDVNGRDVTSAFAVRDDGRFYGRVEGLRIGDNVLTAKAPTAGVSRLTVTNHAIGGPVFAGKQVQPWICRTEENDLGPAKDAQCNVDPVVSYQYMRGAGVGANVGAVGVGDFQPYDPSNPPPAGTVATTTTDEGETVPYIIRVERGVIDRGFYAIAVLADPEQPWEPWEPQKAWNGKLVWLFGSGGEPSHVQIGEPDPTGQELALSRGFAVASTAMAHNSQGFNDVVQAEAVMMVKEHFVERYGEIRYTIGTGCSGGSMSQNALAANYPGLLDGILPACSYPDVLTTYTWFADCKNLHRYFTQVSPHLWNEAQRQQAMGHAAGGTCAIGSTRSASYHSPTAGSNCGDFDWAYDPARNPSGERCSVPDYAIAVYGERPPESWGEIEKANGKGFAQMPYDTVGIEWGLKALRAGTILPEQFVDLNEKVGGLDVDSNIIAGRSTGDPGGIRNAYRSGRFTTGHQMAKVPHIELRGSSNFEWHHDVQSLQLRERLLRDNGHADQMVYWKSPGPLVLDPVMADEALLTIDRWLSAIEDDTSDAPLEQKVLAHKPAEAVDACWFAGQKVTDQQFCQTALPTFSDPRTAAEQPPTNDTAKCVLQPLTRQHYEGVTFTDAQWARLEAAFPQGVCDYSGPGAYQSAPVAPWLTFANGPGGMPLGAPPVATSTGGRATLAQPAAGPVGAPGTVPGAAPGAGAGSLPATGGLPAGVLALVLLIAAGTAHRFRRS